MVSQSRDNFSTKWSRVSSQYSQCLGVHDGRQRVRRRTGELYQPPAVMAHVRYGGGSVVVWGGIAMTGRTGLYNRDVSWSLLLCAMPVRMEMHSRQRWRDRHDREDRAVQQGRVIEPVVVRYACPHGNALQTTMEGSP